MTLCRASASGTAASAMSMRTHIGLRLHLLSNPVDGVLVRLGERAAFGGKIARRLLQRVLVLDARPDCTLDQPAPMELLAMRKHGNERDADRAAGIARGSHLTRRANMGRRLLDELIAFPLP